MISDCPLVHLLEAEGQQENLAPVICHREDDWRVRIAGTWEEYYKARSANLRKTVACGERRLAAMGEVTFEGCTGGPELRERFEEFCRVEAKGWKGRDGTAISCNQAALEFHESLMRSAEERGELRLFFLRIDGRAVACIEMIIQAREAFGIKMGRDEAFDKCAPGHILFKRVLEHFFRTRDAHTFDMMIGGGTHGAYKARWATEKREYVTLRFFNPKTLRGMLARTWFAMQSKLADRDLGNALGGGWFPRLIGRRCN
jgi:CelD/BcsL family acetyltransferase involved in cellulose biosynthesis